MEQPARRQEPQPDPQLDRETASRTDDHHALRLWLRLLTCTHLIEREVRARLRATAEMAGLRSRSGTVPIDDFDDQHEHLLGAAPEDAVLNGASLVRIRNFVVASRTAAAFLRSRVEARPHVAAIVQNTAGPTWENWSAA